MKLTNLFARYSAVWILLAPGTLASSACDGGSDDNGTSAATITGTTGMTTMTGPTTSDPTGDPGTTTAPDTDTDSGGSDTGGPPLERPTCDTPATGTWSGNLYINNASDAALIDGIATVTGKLVISETDLTDLDAFICLKSIGGEFTLYGNQALNHIAGLDNIESVGGILTLSENDKVTHYDSLNKITQLDSLHINKNDAVQEITGFTGLTTITQHLVIQANAELQTIKGLRGLRTVGKTFQVTQNPKLCISDVNAVGGGLEQPPGDLEGSSTASNKSGC